MSAGGGVPKFLLGPFCELGENVWKTPTKFGKWTWGQSSEVCEAMHAFECGNELGLVRASA